MPALTIPEPYEPGMVVIKRLLDSDVERVLGALRDATARSTRQEIASLIEPALPSLVAVDVKALVETLYSLYVARAGADVAANRFVSDLMSAIRQSTNEEIRTSDQAELSRLRKNLSSLLTVPALTTMSKAHALRTDFENTFCDCRIITDLRPVFDTDIKQDPAGAVITHTLKIEHGGKHTEIHIAMDKGDIENLLSTLERVRNKAATLSAGTTKHGLKILAE